MVWRSFIPPIFKDAQDTTHSSHVLPWTYCISTLRDGEGEDLLEEGKKILEKMERWAKNSKAIFESKLILLEAEHYASMCNIVAAKESYELSAESARDHCLMHEQGLACEVSLLQMSHFLT